MRIHPQGNKQPGGSYGNQWVSAILRCDILVTHEAPSSHPHGFAAIDSLAAACGARLIVHGHHHRSYQAVLPNGIAVRGLGVAEPWLLECMSGARAVHWRPVS